MKEQLQDGISPNESFMDFDMFEASLRAFIGQARCSGISDAHIFDVLLSELQSCAEDIYAGHIISVQVVDLRILSSGELAPVPVIPNTSCRGRTSNEYTIN